MDIDKSMKILVLSNDKENSSTVIKCLAKLEFKNVSHKDNGVEALQMMLNDSFDFVICDQDIKFIKGWLFLKEIKTSEKIRNVPVILFGKADAPESEEHLKQYGVIKYLKFPISISNLDFSIHSTLSLFNTSGTTENKYTKAKTALLANDKEAVELYSELRGITQNSTRSSIGLAHAYVNANEIDKAQQVIQEVAESGDTTPTSQILAIKVSLEKENYDKAKELSKVLLKEQDNLFYYSKCVKLFLDFNQYLPAEGLCEDAIKKKFQMPEFHVCLAKCKYSSDKYDEAVKILEEAETIFGISSEILNLRGVCFKKTGAYDNAIDSYEEALRLEPMNPKVYFNIAICLLEMSRIDEAVKQLEACLRIAPNFRRARDKLTEIKEKRA